MPLHLAHHKSYHPYSQKNKDRVARDEAIAALQEAQLHSSSFSADDQARLDLLRKQASRQATRGSEAGGSDHAKARLRAAEQEVLHGKRGHLERHDSKQRQRYGPDPSDAAAVDGKHINFFPQPHKQRGAPSSSSRQGTQSRQSQNPEYLKEQEAARLKFEESIGASLGRPASELRPWYTTADLQNGEERKKSEAQRLEAAYKDTARKTSSDPLKAMESFLSKRKQALEKQRERGIGSVVSSAAVSFRSDEYSDQYNRDAVREAKRARRDDAGGDGEQRSYHADRRERRGSDDRRRARSSRNEDSSSSTRSSGRRGYHDGTERHRTRSSSPTHFAETERSSITSSRRKEADDRGHRGSHRSHGRQADEDRERRRHSDDAVPAPPDDSEGLAALEHADVSLESMVRSESGGSESGGSESVATPERAAGRGFRPGSRSSMYPELFSEMVCTVLEGESYLFSNAEIDLLSAYFMMSYAARYFFVRLLQRKRDTWYRLDRLTAYEQEIGDLRPAKGELARPLSDAASAAADPQDVPKVEHARREEEARRFRAMEDDKENLTLTLPQLQRNLHLDEATGLCSPRKASRLSSTTSKLPLKAHFGSQPKPKPASNMDDRLASSNGGNSAETSDTLRRFVLTEADMRGGADESLSLLTLDELKTLAKKLNITKTGTTRAQHIAALLATKSQATLFGGMSPKKKSAAGAGSKDGRQLMLNFGSSGKKTAQTSRLREELAEVLRGGCIQVVPAVRSLVDRVALVYYRGNLLGSAALTAAILARSRRRNYPIYGFKRSSLLFPSRDHLIAFERALDIEAKMEHLIQFGKSERDHHEALELFESVYGEWKACVDECVGAHPEGIDKLAYHRMRFHPGWILSRVVYKGAACLARFKQHDREKDVLTRLLDQKVFRRGRRGDWYDRLALITALYSPDVKKGKKEALQISIRGIQDPDTHLIYHDTLQRRIGRLESQLRVPRSEQHDFSYAKLKRTTEVVFEGVRLDVMLDRDESAGTSPSARMDSFLGRAKSSSPSPSSVRGMKRSGSDKSLGGSPLKKQHGEASMSPSTSGFVVRKPMYKRVKLERFAKPEPASPDKVGESEASLYAPASTTSSPQHEVESPQRPRIKQEESSDSLDLALDGIDASTLQEDPTLFSLGIGGGTSEQPVEVRRETRTSMRSVWRGLDNAPCHVEELCLQHYARQGFKGSHCEGKILTMIFALVMWDVLFRTDVEGAFETPFQAAPLDLGSDAFAIVRSAEIRQRLDEVEQTGGLHLIAAADDEQRPRRTWAVGCRWDLFSKEDLLEVAECLGGHSIAVICQMFCEEWEHCTGGMPDLVIWRMRDRCVRFVEVKGPGDRLSETQKVWIDVLLRAGVDVQVGLVVEGGAKAERSGSIPAAPKEEVEEEEK